MDFALCSRAILLMLLILLIAGHDTVSTFTKLKNCCCLFLPQVLAGQGRMIDRPLLQNENAAVNVFVSSLSCFFFFKLLIPESSQPLLPELVGAVTETGVKFPRLLTLLVLSLAPSALARFPQMQFSHRHSAATFKDRDRTKLTTRRSNSSSPSGNIAKRKASGKLIYHLSISKHSNKELRNRFLTHNSTLHKIW